MVILAGFGPHGGDYLPVPEKLHGGGEVNRLVYKIAAARGAAWQARWVQEQVAIAWRTAFTVARSDDSVSCLLRAGMRRASEASSSATAGNGGRSGVTGRPTLR